MLDIGALFYTSNRMQKVVINFISGIPIRYVTLSGLLLAKYPIDENRQFYSLFRRAKDVCLDGVEEKDLKKTLSIFKIIDSLSLARTRIIEKVDYFPSRLKSVSLIGVQIEEKWMVLWLSKLNKTLMFLNLQNIQTHFMEFQAIDLRLQVSCPKLRSLTVIGDTVKFSVNHNNLQSLRVEARKRLECNIEAYKYLEALHFILPKVHFVHLYKFPKLRAVTMNHHHHWQGAPPQSLEHLRIFYPLDPKYREDFEALEGEIKTVQVHFYPEAEKEQDLMLLELNHYCLLELVKYLPMKDQFAFAHTHSKIFKLIIQNCCGEMIINSDNINLLKNELAFCKQAAPFIRILKIGTGCEHLHWIVPLCTSLKDLHLKEVELTADFIHSWPLNLKHFSLTSKFAVNLAASYKDIDNALARFFTRLNGIEGIRFDSTISEDALVGCFERNKTTLKFVSCVFKGLYEKDFDWTWATRASLPQLDSLTLAYYHQTYYQFYPILPQDMEVVLSSLGPQLKKLKVDIGIQYFGEAINVGQLPYLQELELQISLPKTLCLSATDLSGVSSLEKLEKLTFKRVSGFTFKWFDSDVWHLIKSLPELKHLQIDNFQSSIRFQKELEDYIKQDGRTLVFNSHRF